MSRLCNRRKRMSIPPNAGKQPLAQLPSENNARETMTRLEWTSDGEPRGPVRRLEQGFHKRQPPRRLQIATSRSGVAARGKTTNASFLGSNPVLV